MFSGVAQATLLKGLVSDAEGKPLPYASVLVVGTSKGAIANSQGRYELSLSPGKYTLLCQYVGYAQQQSVITIQQEAIEVNFILLRQELVMPDVVLTKGEDPAYEIIRSTIAQQAENLDRIRAYSCQVYSKGQLRLRSFPKKFMGEKVDFEDGDSSQQKIIYLSETVSRFSIGEPAKRKVEVISSKVSGSSDGYGLAVPDQYSLYR
ncbi:MAG: carboxypeptidase-like regulatory domain-containing protein, partial [Chitinophagia bacterium]|nr:carboxypeptidase-like regulatory domain-containing protein [Chitinophagia bacterium]